MKRYIITGTSSGIGKALALKFLEDADAHVLGISRRTAIVHERFTHLRADLSKIEALEDVEFEFTGLETEIVLVNCAGWIGEIAPLGSQDHLAIEESFNINLVAPSILINQFLIQTKNLNARRVIVNISSGAAKHPIKSWATYCASKAGLEMLTRVLNEEHPEIESYAISPGIVNTNMQQDIRDAKPGLFPDQERFKNYFVQGELKSPEEVAAQIVYLLHNPNQIPQKVFSLRELTKSES